MSYTSNFQDVGHALHYENEIYAEKSYSSFIWELQRPVLKQIISECGATSVLDFACGTGRILATLEECVPQVVGVDTSEQMTNIARRKCNAVIHVGTISEISELANAKFDLVTCFRFLLNAEPALREEVVAELSARLSPNGVLIANIHGNTHSLRHLGLLYRQHVLAERHCEMSRKEARCLFARHGLRVVEERGFGVLPPRLHHGRLLPVARFVDRALGRVPIAAGSIDVLYVCRKS